MVMSAPEPDPPGRRRRMAAQVNELLPLAYWYKHQALRSWPVILFLVLICVPPIALVVLGGSPSIGTFRHVAWIFAAYFALAWLLLLGIIIRPEHVTRTMLVVVVAIALATQVPLAVALETALHSNTSGLGSSIMAVGFPEELAKALPVLAAALIYRRRAGLNSCDYLFLGAVSGLAFGAADVVRYFTVNGGAEFYLTVQSVVPEIERLLRAGNSVPASLFTVLIGPGRSFILDFVWRFITDPITHACWSGLTGYFIGLAVTGRYKWYEVGWIGFAAAAVLHGLNDWGRVNGNPLWIVVVLVSGLLFLGYAKVGTRDDLHFSDGPAPDFLVLRREPSGSADGQPAVGTGEPRAGQDAGPAGGQPAGGRGRPWWEH
jgi:RsiW-degrading membrane proteinase PrsW (M82 family)